MFSNLSMGLKRVFLSGRYHLRKYTFRSSRRYLVLLLLSIGCLLLYVSLQQNYAMEIFDSGAGFRRNFYSALFQAIQDGTPEGQLIMDSVRDKEKCRDGDISAFSTDFEKSSYENLDACFHLSDDRLGMLASKHEKFVEAINSWKFSKSDIDKLFPNESGIVTIGGSKYSVISLTMLETLRDRGSKLPVEVMIPPGDEGDEDYCNVVLPKLGAKCVYMAEKLPPDVVKNVKIERYQNKIVGLLLSSFKNVVYIDADCLPLKPLDDVFNSPAYKKHGLILWPDIWKRVTAPAFYKLANIPLDLKKRVRFGADDVSPLSRYEPSSEASEVRMLKKVPFHDLEGTMSDPTTESGQMLINKVDHLRSLLLSAYYNIHGKWYYKMLSQGTSGEGDKETLIAAAHALKLPYYQVKTDVRFDGFSDHEGFHGISLYQQDFQQDYEAYKKAIRWVRRHKSELSAYEQNYDVKKQFYEKLLKPGDKEVESLFGHISYHKFEPIELAEKSIYIDEKGKHFRGFRRKEVIRHFDLEMFNFEVLEKYLCKENPVKFVYYKDRMDTPEWERMCNYLKSHVSYLQDTHEELFSS
ncbi:hypothetical protein ZYGR_0N07350 [Zygosaccharomyces rouxii]|uniref:ZYRO0D17160p n=2 Tax=Zygosaccharomyces rouxii TaxID=4956 RepID=C5DWS3_ZYGRC|nr:uncharacterized protein ZYRO0D17160g [Zygosaccharomyces rouxii]KAH9201152.1 alpha-1,2-mannosyltransferase MNN5 [Zygosaccharomyces rouxii]GAV49328.1 hypothetical protein ZYGR_0N07350 [Zygosaccharomyces rouxii]CAQ43502.1 Alpha-1,2-mannosyltransferase MNN5 [Zygosaccharomyces rouxii]CAR28242.1 ZYRO0D17160p [Zygosaccharomyces rouxii]